MSLQIKITNDSESIAIERSKISENYLITNTDGQAIWMTEEELRELKIMIDDMLQYVHKRDW